MRALALLACVPLLAACMSVNVGSPARIDASKAAEGWHRAHTAARVDATVAALKQAFAARGIRVFAVIDHAEAARAAGLSMLATQIVVFGNPAAGTPLMQAHPELALDLPLRVLVREAAPGRTEVLWHPVAALERSAAVPGGSLAALAGVDGLIRGTVEAIDE